MRLLYVTNKISGSGGLERVLSIKTSYFADFFDYDIHILTFNDNQGDTFFHFNKKITRHNEEAAGNPINYLSNYYKGIKRIAKTINPDIVVVCDDGIKGFYIPFVIKGIPTIYERHVSKVVAQGEKKISWITRFTTKFKYALMNFGGKKYTSFVVLTQGNLNEWNFPSLKVIPNPLPQFPDYISDLGNKNVIAVGKHCYQKGYDRLLKVWQSVSKRHPDWTLSIYGEFNPHHRLDQWVKELSIENTVKLFPPVKDIQKHFLNSSIHVLSSRYEGFGMVIIEAMSCGVPSISFDCPHGPSDIISNGVNGLLVENADLDGFSRALCKLIENDSLRFQMAQRAKKDIEKYKIENVALKWKELFESLLPLDKGMI